MVIVRVYVFGRCSTWKYVSMFLDVLVFIFHVEQFAVLVYEKEDILV